MTDAELADDLTIACLVGGMADQMIPVYEGRKRAQAHREAQTPQWNDLRWHMVFVVARLRELGVMPDSLKSAPG